MRLRRPSTRYFGVSALVLRLCAALFVVLSTYNPSGVSYYHWIVDRWPGDWLLQVPVALVYLVAYFHLMRATFKALTPPGIALAIGFMGAIVWCLLDLQIIELTSAGDLGLISLYMLGGLFAVGVSWMWVYTLITGQVNLTDLSR